MRKRIFISTGEVSGDLHGSLLARELIKESKKKSIDLDLYGLGGERMREAGVKIICDTTPISAIGLWEALPLVIPMFKIQKKFFQALVSNNPDCLIMIDYMGPNISIGRKLKRKKFDIPIYYYIAPQEWAWRVGNNSTTDLIGFSDKIFAIFQQEANFYQKRGGKVLFVGHPMIDLTKKLPTKKIAREYLKLKNNQNILLIMPASRPQELRYVLPNFMQVAQKLQKKYPTLMVFILSCRQEFDQKFENAFQKYHINGRIIKSCEIESNKTYIYTLSKLALCKSGTVNMELALYGIPQVVGYKVSRVTAFVAKRILNFKVKYISPVNLLMKKLIIPEFVQKDFEVNKIFKKSCKLIENKNEKIKIKKGYLSLRSILGSEGVVQRAAIEILNSLI
tara:strand:+ start:9931 stop:11109 length:1179 start_codon:yes stop_codon:yes gene_type:complete